MPAFSSFGEQRPLSNCDMWASHCGGFSCCRALALGCLGFRGCSSLQLWSMSSVVVVHRFNCPAACGIFPGQVLNPCPLHWQVILNHWTAREVLDATFWCEDGLVCIKDGTLFSSHIWSLWLQSPIAKSSKALESRVRSHTDISPLLSVTASWNLHFLPHQEASLVTEA